MTCGPTDWRPKIARFLEGNARPGWAGEYGINRGTTRCEDKKERATEKLGWACLPHACGHSRFCQTKKSAAASAPTRKLYYTSNPERQPASGAPKVIEMGKTGHPSILFLPRLAGSVSLRPLCLRVSYAAGPCDGNPFAFCQTVKCNGGNKMRQDLRIPSTVNAPDYTLPSSCPSNGNYGLEQRTCKEQ